MSWTKEEKAKIRQSHRYLKEILNKDAMETIMDHYIEADFDMSVAKQIIHLFSISEKFEGLCKFIENIQLTPDGYSFFLHILRKCNYGYIAERIESTTIEYGQNSLSGQETQAKDCKFLQQTQSNESFDQTLGDESLQPTLCDESLQQTLGDESLQQTLGDESLQQTLGDESLKQTLRDESLQQTQGDESLQHNPEDFLQNTLGDVLQQTQDGQARKQTRDEQVLQQCQGDRTQTTECITRNIHREMNTNERISPDLLGIISDRTPLLPIDNGLDPVNESNTLFAGEIIQLQSYDDLSNINLECRKMKIRPELKGIERLKNFNVNVNDSNYQQAVAGMRQKDGSYFMWYSERKNKTLLISLSWRRYKRGHVHFEMHIDTDKHGKAVFWFDKRYKSKSYKHVLDYVFKHGLHVLPAKVAKYTGND